MFNVLIIGSGGREHALAWKLKQSPKVGEIFIAPGNAGTARVGTNVEIKATDFKALINFAKKENITLTVVGPDEPLALGVVNAFQSQGLKIWGPSKKASALEASKSFAKELMLANHIPTAEFKVFTDFKEAVKYIKESGAPIVIKASGLALGKGVAVCQTVCEAENFLDKVMVKKVFGEAGSQVIIEEFLAGAEFSIHAFSDGQTFQLLPPSQDHKSIYDEDKGSNTGGMGTVAPLPWVDQNLINEITKRVVNPALEGLKKLDAPFVGLLYPGLMLTTDGIKTLEFNARLGDPETQSYMRLLKTDLYDILTACVDGKLNEINIEWENKYACCVVLASGGYPGEYEKGKMIIGVEEASKLDNIVVFHAGTAIKDDKLTTNGGRVLGVTAVADDLQTALDKAYTAIKLINFEGMHYRKDIGQKSLSYTLNATR